MKSRIPRQKSYSDTATGTSPSPTQLARRLRWAHPVVTHLRLLPNGVPHSLRTEEEASSRLVIPLRNTSHNSGNFGLEHYAVMWSRCITPSLLALFLFHFVHLYVYNCVQSTKFSLFVKLGILSSISFLGACMHAMRRD